MCAEPSSLVDGTLVKALARAHRWQGMLEGGEYGSIEELSGNLLFRPRTVAPFGIELRPRWRISANSSRAM